MLIFYLNSLLCFCGQNFLALAQMVTLVPFGRGPVRFPHKIKESIQRFLHFAAVTPIQGTK